MQVFDVFYFIPLLISSIFVGHICFFYSRKISTLTVALSAPFGLACLSFLGITSRGLFGGYIGGGRAFIFGIVAASLISMTLFIWMNKENRKNFIVAFSKYLIIFFVIALIFAFFSPFRSYGIESLQLTFGSDHLGYLEGGWFFTSNHVLPQGYNFNQNPDGDFLALKGGQLVAWDSRALIYGLIPTVSFFMNIPWWWSYLPAGTFIFSMLGALLVILPRNHLIKILIFSIFFFSQFFDIVMMGYLAKSFYWLIVVAFLIRLLRFPNSSSPSTIFLGCLLASAYSLYPFLLIVASIIGAVFIYCLAQYKEFYINIVKQRSILIQIGLTILGGFISTGWSRNYQFVLEVGANAEGSPFTPINLLLVNWDFSWWGSQHGYTSLVLTISLLFYALGIALLFYKLYVKDFNCAIPITIATLLSCICFIPSLSLASYRLTSLPFLMMIIGISLSDPIGKKAKYIIIVLLLLMLSLFAQRFYRSPGIEMHDPVKMKYRIISRDEIRKIVDCSQNSIINIVPDHMDDTLAVALYLFIKAEGGSVEIPDRLVKTERNWFREGQLWNPKKHGEGKPSVDLLYSTSQWPPGECVAGNYKVVQQSFKIN
jgi:hypothetical protein